MSLRHRLHERGFIRTFGFMYGDCGFYGVHMVYQLGPAVDLSGHDDMSAHDEPSSCTHTVPLLPMLSVTDRDDCFYWESVVMMRKFLIIVVVVFLIAVGNETQVRAHAPAVQRHMHPPCFIPSLNPPAV